MTNESMMFWIKNILAPYVEAIRKLIGQDKKCYIIADGCTAHNSSEVEKALNTHTAYLPP